MADSKELIEKAAIKAASIYGLKGVRVKHIQKLSGLCGSSIYTYFGGEKELMIACFERIDHQVAALFDDVDPKQLNFQKEPDEIIYKLWLPYFEWFVAHPNETVFYQMFREDPSFNAYNKSRDVSHFTNFFEILKAFKKAYPQSARNMKNNIAWIHLLNGTLTYARNVNDRNLPFTDQTETDVFAFLMYGLSNIIK
jgi:AcrR family transcriptional regulator